MESKSKMTNDEQEPTEVTLSRWVIPPALIVRTIPAKRLEPGPFLARAGMVGVMVGKLRRECQNRSIPSNDALELGELVGSITCCSRLLEPTSHSSHRFSAPYKCPIDVRRFFMWHIEYRGLTLQEVLIMAYMNLLEAGDRPSFPAITT